HALRAMTGTTRRNLLRGAAATALLAATGSALGACQRPLLTAPAPRKMARLGFLALTTADDYAPHTNAFRAGLHDLGYAEGRNISIEERFAQGHEEALVGLAAELVESRVDVLVTASTQAALAAIAVTSNTPIVFFNSGDPLGSGVVSGLARPGGNATGLTSL